MRLIDGDKLRRKVQRIATEAWMMKLTASVETTLNQFIDYIDEAPTIDKPQWIPCSERLPKKDGRYQVTRHDDVTNTEFIDILWYEENLWWNRRSTGNYAVTAWMPLPEPWKGAEE